MITDVYCSVCVCVCFVEDVKDVVICFFSSGQSDATCCLHVKSVSLTDDKCMRGRVEMFMFLDFVWFCAWCYMSVSSLPSTNLHLWIKHYIIILWIIHQHVVAKTFEPCRCVCVWTHHISHTFALQLYQFSLAQLPPVHTLNCIWTPQGNMLLLWPMSALTVGCVETMEQLKSVMEAQASLD